MKRILILMIILIAAPLGVFASKEAAMPLNVSAIKESDVYNFEIKNAKAKDEIEIEVKSEGNESKGLFKKNIISKDDKNFVSISQKELDSAVGPSSGYAFRLRFANKDKFSGFSNELHLGKAPVFRNYSNWAYQDLLKAEDLKLFSKEVATDTRAKITREDYAVVIANIFELNNSKNVSMKDRKKIAKYARESVNKALNAKYLTLDEKKNFNPKKEMNREEVISSIVRHI